MTWPSGAVNTTNVDSTSDDPELAVVDIKSSFDKLNQIIAHVPAFAQTLLDDTSASAARATLGLGTSDSPTFTGVVTSLVKASAGNGLQLGGNNVASWQIWDGATNTLVPLTDNAQALGRADLRISTVFTPILDSGTTGALSLRTNNGTTQLELPHSAGANHATITSGTNPTISTTAGSLNIGAPVTGAITVKRKTADKSVTSSAALQDDDHLTFPIGANEEWVAHGTISVGQGLDTGGIKFAFNFPAGATALLSGSMLTGNAADALGGSVTAADAVLFQTSARANAAGVILYHIWCLNGATPGNIVIRWAQGTSNGTGLIFKKGSFLNATRIA